MQGMLRTVDDMNIRAYQCNDMDVQDFTCDPRHPNVRYTHLFPCPTKPWLREKFMVRMNRVLSVVVQSPLSLLVALLFWL